MRFLFVKSSLSWPRTSGHDVHCYHMMQALAERGHDVALLTLVQPETAAIAGLTLIDQCTLPDQDPENTPDSDWRGRWSWPQERFRSYWGIDKAHVRFTRDHADALGVDAVVVVGIEVLPYLAEVRGPQRVWYAADEWVWHHLSLVEARVPSSWQHVRNAAIMGAYERAFASVIDRAWMVSRADQRAFRWVAGVSDVDLIPNGVDANAFSPTGDLVNRHSCTFWGNLGFTPNEQALIWFCERVWPEVMRRRPEASFTIYGFDPSASVRQLAQREGVSLVADVPDIRQAVSREAVVVLPFQSGGGIKNKMLEAAGLSKAIVCSARACNGLNTDAAPPFRTLSSHPGQWVDCLIELWDNPETCHSLGAAAREWVVKHHSWQAAADQAASAISDGRRLPAVASGAAS